MAGYSSVPLARKLGIHTGSRVTLLDAPPGIARELDPLPPDTVVRYDAALPADVTVLFGSDVVSLPGALASASRALVGSGGLWVAWRKGGAAIPGALTEGAVRAAGLEMGLVDTKVCAINTVWSGLRFVVRASARADWPVR